MTRRLMTGNEAVARAAYEAGCRVVSAYPGTPSTEITENAVKYDEIYAEWAPNEKVALEVAIGASIGGVRALAAMKHVGLNVAADPLFTVAYSGVRGGLVVVSADDPGMHSSQNEQDNRNYGQAARVPVLEPADSQEALDFTKAAFALSEEFDTPVILRLTTRTAHSSSLVELGERQDIPLIPYGKDAQKFVMIPANARRRHVVVEDKLADLTEQAALLPFNKLDLADTSVGVICSGAVYHYVKEALPQASVLKIGLSHPLSAKLFKTFAASVDKVYVIEELQPRMEDFARSCGISLSGVGAFPRVGEITPKLIEEVVLGKKHSEVQFDPVVARPPVMCAGCPHRGLFYLLNKLKVVVSGDIGCYTLACSPPLEAMDTTICMGASIGVAHGMEKALGRDFSRHTVAVLGESTFLHSGMTGLLNVVYNQSAVTTIILDNSITAMTGHQQNPASGLNAKGQPAPACDFTALVKALGVDHVVTCDPYDLPAMEKALRQALAFDGPSVIISRRPCVLIEKRAPRAPYFVDRDKCVACGLCLKAGCPALGAEQGDKAFALIEQSQCVACGLCASICKKGAIAPKEAE